MEPAVPLSDVCHPYLEYIEGWGGPNIDAVGETPMGVHVSAYLVEKTGAVGLVVCPRALLCKISSILEVQSLLVELMNGALLGNGIHVDTYFIQNS